MKKSLILIIFCFFLISCSSLSKEQHLYYQFVSELKGKDDHQFTNQLPLNITVHLEKIIKEELRYQVIIDQPHLIMNNIKAIVIHNQETKDVFPSLGIFDETLNLLPEGNDAKGKQPKGIILIGYIPYLGPLDSFEGWFRVLVQYEDEHGKLNKIFYLYQK